jgi:1,4-alpha-glucan branching enzyme
VSAGGMGFSYKWNMGWMNDILRYMSYDPVYRKETHNWLTFSFMYAFSEKFILPLSHDEVVHGKKSLLAKMPGDDWQKFANLRLLYGYMMAHPGKKLLFMGGEFGQFAEWSEKKVLDWQLLAYDMHKWLQQYVQDLNHLYCREPALWERDDDWSGFSWIDNNDYRQSIITFMRQGNDTFILVVCNFTPVVRQNYRIGVPVAGQYEELFNSDCSEYGGSGVRNRALTTESLSWHNQPYSVQLTIPPLAVIYLVYKAKSSHIQDR